MDSNSNSCEMYWPKIEMDSDNERDSNKKDPKAIWTSENTMKLIDTLEKDCKELWDTKNPLNKDRVARQARLEYLANIFGTSAEEISRKIHNLRTQFNNELRKIKRRQATSVSLSDAGQGGSGWEYFDALSFLLRATSTDPLDSVDSVNLAIRTKMYRKTKQNNEDRLRKKRLAERRRYESIKNDPHKYELQRIKERQKYLKKKADKKKLDIKDMTPAQQMIQRKKWREYNRNRRKRKKDTSSESESDEDLPSECEIDFPQSSDIFIKFEEEDMMDAEKLLAEFQADEEEEFGAAARARVAAAEPSTTSTPARNRQGKPALRVAASAPPPPLPPNAHPMLWSEEPILRLRPSLSADECQIFGDFVASELRTLRSDESRKKLKRVIQKAILKIGEEEDMDIIGG